MMKTMLTSKFYRTAVLALVIMLASSTSAFASFALPLSYHHGSVGWGSMNSWSLDPRAYHVEFVNSGPEPLNVQISIKVSGTDYVLYSNSSFAVGSQFIMFDTSSYYGASEVTLRVTNSSFSTVNYSFRYNINP